MLRIIEAKTREEIDVTIKVPNTLTKKAIVELESGKGKKFSNIESLIDDLHEDDCVSKSLYPPV